MQPPSARACAFDATCSARLDCRVDTIPFGLHGILSDFRLLELLLIDGRTKRALLAVSDARVALPDFYNVTIRIADVAPRLAVLGFWLGDELGSAASP